MSDPKSEPEAVASPPGDGEPDLDALFRCLASSDRRQLLGVLYARSPAALTRRDLATALTRRDRGNPPARDSDGALRQVIGDLRHTHLPKLEAAGLIDRDTARGTVTLSAHPAFEDPGIVTAISDGTDVETGSLDALFAALADPRRRTILDVLSHQVGPIHRETLARELAATERGVSESDVSTGTVEGILVRLHHVHLPHLSEAELVEYDPAGQTVAYAGHRELRVPWMHSALGPAFRRSLTGETEPEGVGELHGREPIVSFGQSLCDRADEELSCVFTATGLLEAGCFTRIRDASRRGVDVYLGTRDPTVREYVQEHAPEVVLWEPTANWLDGPATSGRLGRLLMADREAAMLGTLPAGTTDGVHEERAIIGEGTTDTLVTMVRRLLTPHLDGIGGRGEDLESEQPI